jgi:hypothetical protein
MTQAAMTPKGEQDGIVLQNRTDHTDIWVTFDKVGFHRYPDAPEEVSYLRETHRHVFMFKVEIQVFHDDREIEFHMFKNWLTSLYEGGDLQVDYKSCEMLAQELIDKIVLKYNCSMRTVAVTVSEDGECGATVFSRPTQPLLLSKEWLLRAAAKLQMEPEAGKEAA